MKTKSSSRSKNARTSSANEQPNTEMPVETRPIRSLKSFHLQNEVLLDSSEQDIESLVQDIRTNGLRIPLEILPDGTIIDGHQRLRACKTAGMKYVPCRVRHDLVDKPLEQEQQFISLNLQRRQLSTLAKTRCIKKQFKIEQERYRLGQSERPQGISLRDYVAKQLNMTGRNAERWIKVLDLPLPLQEGVEQGRLKLDYAAKLALRDEDEWQIVLPIAERGQDCNEIVQQLLGQASDPQVRLYGYQNTLQNLANQIPGDLGRLNPDSAATSPGIRNAMQDSYSAAMKIVETLQPWCAASGATMPTA